MPKIMRIQNYHNFIETILKNDDIYVIMSKNKQKLVA